MSLVNENKLPGNDYLDISSFQSSLELKFLQNSYKPFWIWAILELLGTKNFKRDYTDCIYLNMHDIATKMLSLAWVPTINYRLNFGNSDQLGSFIREIFEANPTVKRNLDAIQIRKIIQEYTGKNQIIIDKLIRYVPYRFISPFYSEQIKGIPDGKKNLLIKEFSVAEPHIYKILDDQSLGIPKEWYNYLTINKEIISSWIKLKLIHFLERRNPNIPAISRKLEIDPDRNLNKKRLLWSDFLVVQDAYDIISGSKIDNSNFHLDHYIPWSFVQHNQLWNLSPMVPENNLKKSDSLPDWEDSFDIFSENQYRFYCWLNKNVKKKALEEYIYVLKDIFISDFSSFSDKMEGTLKPQWQIASSIGY